MNRTESHDQQGMRLKMEGLEADRARAARPTPAELAEGTDVHQTTASATLENVVAGATLFPGGGAEPIRLRVGVIGQPTKSMRISRVQAQAIVDALQALLDETA